MSIKVKRPRSSASITMRFCYLHIAVLAGILAATAPADSTSTSATLREEPSRPFDRNDLAAIGSSVGDEDRAGEFGQNLMTIKHFAKNVLLNDFGVQNTAMKGLSNKFNEYVEEGLLPHEHYIEMVDDATKKGVLTTPAWISWAFFAGKYSNYEHEDPHEYIVKSMTSLYGAGQFAEVLAVAVYNPEMKFLAKKLQEVQLSSWLEKRYQPQQVFNLLQMDQVWRHNLFDSPRFVTWTHYLKCLYGVAYEKNPIGIELLILRDFIEYGALLKMLMMPENASHPKSVHYLQALMLFGLSRPTSPDQIVSMLLKGIEKSDHQFRLLFIYEPIRNCWMVYADWFNMMYPGFNAPLLEKITSIYGLPKLLVKLHAYMGTPDAELSGMTLWYVKLQFLEWKMSGVTDILEKMPDLTTSDNFLVIEVFRRAYFKYYYTSGYQLSKADFIM